MSIVILHTNDFHGTLTDGKAAFIRSLKEEGDALYFDSGDCIKTGNLGIPLKPEKAWDLLANAGCDASVMGNRETHIHAGAFAAKLAGHKHPILVANLRAKKGEPPAQRHLIIERGGLRIGVFGVMVPMVTEKMATQAASQFLWDPPIATAAAVAGELRSEVDLLIALTHIGYKQDLKLAEEVPSIDLVLGGHSHTVLDQPTKVGNTWICQGGSHGRFVGRYVWSGGLVSAELKALPT